MPTFVNQSFGGGCTPTHLAASVTSSAMSCTLASATDWYEVGADGSVTTNPLGTSGHFALKLDYGLTTEETVICSAVNLSTGVVTIVKRGADGTTAQAHPAGSAALKNAFPTQTAVDWVNAQAGISEAVTNASSALSTANSKVASVTAADGTITIAGTSTAPTVKVTDNTFDAYGAAATKLPLAGGTLTGALSGTSATFSGAVSGSDIKATGLTGATTATRYVGGTVNGAPTSGTFAKGDFIVDQSGTIWVCTTAGTPGTWTTTISSHASLRTASATVSRNETTIFSGSTASQTLTAPSSPIDGSTWTVVNKASVPVILSFTPSMVPLGSAPTTTYTVSAGGAYSFINYNGSQWYMVGTNGADHMVDYSSVALSAWGAASANVAMGSNKITSLADGTASTDAATFGQVSAKVASVTAGDTSVTVAGTSTAPTVAVAQANLVIVESQVTNLVTDLAAKVPTSRTISTTAPLAGGGDLTANRTLSIADASTSVKGAVQLTDSTSSTSITTAATPNSVKGAYDLALRAPVSPNIGIHASTQTGQTLKAWNADPNNIGLFSSFTTTISSGIHFFTAISIPYAMTISNVWVWQTTGAVAGTSGAFYGFGIYDTSGNLLASTANQVSSGFIGLTGNVVWNLSSSYSIAAGNYMVGMLWYSGTGGTPTLPVFGKTGGGTFSQLNVNCSTPSAGKLDQRACTAGTGRTSLYTSLAGVTPTQATANFWAALS